MTQQTGEAKLGFALTTVITTTVTDAKDKEKEVTSMSMEVTDLKVTSLDKHLALTKRGDRAVRSGNAAMSSVRGRRQIKMS